MAVIRDIATGLERQRFTRLVILNGHGGNWSLGPVVREINQADGVIKVMLLNYWEHDTSPEGQALHENDVHAGAWETSLMLAVAPDLVGDYADVEPTGFDGSARQSDLNHLGMAVLRPNGVWGDPRNASADAGRAIAASVKENLVAAARERLDWFDRHPSYGGGEK